MKRLVYDRTTSDVNYARQNQSSETSLKGAYNYTDLNRVEEWCRKLADDLNAVGYSISITTKTDWTQDDFPTYSNMERIRQNILKIMRGYHYQTKIYNTVNGFDYRYANNWEKILSEIYDMIRGMENWYVFSGVANSGQNRLWQNRFRKLYISILTEPITTESDIVLFTENNEELEAEEWE